MFIFIFVNKIMNYLISSRIKCIKSNFWSIYMYYIRQYTYPNYCTSFRDEMAAIHYIK